MRPVPRIAGMYLVPYVGLPALVPSSSLGYYAWRKNAAEKARTLNRHTCIAWAIAVAVTMGWLLRR